MLTNQKRYWNMVKIGHQDLILTTLLKASGRFQKKANHGQMKSEKLKCDQLQLKDVAMYLYKHIIAQLCDIKIPSAIINKSRVKIITRSKNGHK